MITFPALLFCSILQQFYLYTLPGNQQFDSKKNAAQVSNISFQNSDSGSVFRMLPSPDGRHFFITFYGYEIQIRFFQTHPLKLIGTRPMHAFSYNAAYSKDGRWAAVDEDGGTGPSRVSMFKIDRGFKLYSIMHGAEDFAQLRFIQNDRVLVGLSGNGTIFKWRIPSGKVIAKSAPFGRWNTSLYYLPAKSRALIACQDGVSNHWKIIDAAKNITSKAGHSVSWPAREIIDFMSNGSQPIALLRPDSAGKGGNEHSPLLFVDPFTGKVLRQLGLDSDIAKEYLDWGETHISPDGTQIVTRIEERKRLAVFSLMDGRRVQLLEAPHGLVSQEWAFLNSRYIAAPLGKSYIVWDVQTGRIVLTLIPDLLPATERSKPSKDSEWMAYSPDGTFAGSKNCLNYFNLAGVKLRREEHRIQKIVDHLLQQ